MVRYRRAISDNPDQIYFFTIVTKNREEIFKSRSDFVKLWETLSDKCKRSNGEIIAFVFLPNHLHILLKQGSIPFSTLIAGFKRKMNSFYFESKGSLWQPRFWEHKIRDDKDLSRHFDYIHYNPVKHGYAKSPRDWQYSSFMKYVDLEFYPLDWAEDGGDIYTGEIY